MKSVSNIKCQRDGGTHDYGYKAHHCLREQPGTGSWLFEKPLRLGLLIGVY